MFCCQFKYAFFGELTFNIAQSQSSNFITGNDFSIFIDNTIYVTFKYLFRSI